MYFAVTYENNGVNIFDKAWKMEYYQAAIARAVCVVPLSLFNLLEHFWKSGTGRHWDPKSSNSST